MPPVLVAPFAALIHLARQRGTTLCRARRVRVYRDQVSSRRHRDGAESGVFWLINGAERDGADELFLYVHLVEPASGTLQGDCGWIGGFRYFLGWITQAVVLESVALCSGGVGEKLAFSIWMPAGPSGGSRLADLGHDATLSLRSRAVARLRGSGSRCDTADVQEHQTGRLWYDTRISRPVKIWSGWVTTEGL